MSDLGAGERNRTADLPLTRRMLCLLSYTGECPPVTLDADPCQSTGSPQAGGTRVTSPQVPDPRPAVIG
jgi:hypothetical protein